VIISITLTCEPRHEPGLARSSEGAVHLSYLATDLGYLLHKHPDKLQSYELSVGTAYVFYPEATPERCAAALLLEVDPIGLVRSRRTQSSAGGVDATALGQYVNDRPYATSSLMTTALTKVFRTAMTGRCDARPELAAAALPLEIAVPALPCRGGADLARRIFEPLGWTVLAEPVPLDPVVPEWGDSRYLSVRLTGTVRLADALNHLYVLLPVLDDAKHYWVSPDEVDKLIRAGGGWLAGHPDKELIARRYLRNRASLTRVALARLAEVDDLDSDAVDDIDSDAVDDAERDEDPGAAPQSAPEAEPSRGELSLGELSLGELGLGELSLREQRRGAVLAAVRASGARRVGDLGCGEGALLSDLLAERDIEHVLATDVSVRSLEIAARRLRLETMPDAKRSRISLIQSSLTYRDERLTGLDAAVLMEVIEHVDLPRLGALEDAVFAAARPGTVIVTTPNAEYNARFTALAPDAFRHRDHRFEWSRAEFRSWADRVAATNGYRVRFVGIGAEDAEVGTASQLAVFER
jgi:SAM-dependent methyltransferase